MMPEQNIRRTLFSSSGEFEESGRQQKNLSLVFLGREKTLENFFLIPFLKHPSGRVNRTPTLYL
jgi:hypothetical protein